MPDAATAPTALNKTQRAAVLLMSLGEQEAAEVLKQLSAKEVQKLGLAMTQIANVSKNQVENVVDEFVDVLDKQTSLGMGADDYVRKVLTQALGQDKANGLIDRILLGRNTKGLETLKWMEPRAIGELIRNEHPQIMAIVLAYLDPDQAAEVIKQLPEKSRSEVLLRIATLDGVPPSALDELNEIMERQFAGKSSQAQTGVGGVKVTANILNFIDAQTEQQIMAGIREVDADLGNKIADLMFVFDNLAELDDRSMQTVLKDVPGDKLGLALRGADQRVKDKITKNMSQRAAQILVEDMEARGPVRLSDVETAQKEILAIVRGLIDSGTIAMGGKGEEFV
jgi:flagellar motor switch protein FliG